MPTRQFMLPVEKFPVTVKLLSAKDGSVVWSVTVQLMDRGTLEAVRVPSFRGSVHWPVRGRVEYGDGTVEEDR